MESVVCSKCFHTKPLKDYPKNKNTKTGYSTFCKECKNNYYKNYLNNKKACSDIKTRKYFEYKLFNIKEQDLKKFPEHECTLTVDDLMEIYLKHDRTCFYSRKQLKPGSRVNIFSKISFDRIDNTLPHTKENLQLTSVFMNMMRGELTNEQFQKILKEYDF
jgi:hypothetical protein